jgi:hypothetical protein
VPRASAALHIIPTVTDADAKRVSISYVREDSSAVDSLCQILEAAQIPYWRDRVLGRP